MPCIGRRSSGPRTGLTTALISKDQSNRDSPDSVGNCPLALSDLSIGVFRVMEHTAQFLVN